MHNEESINEDMDNIQRVASKNLKKMSSTTTDKSIGVIPVMMIIVTVLAVVIMVTKVEGRYLPTRSDETRLESLKQLLKTMMDYNQDMDENTNNWPANSRVAYGGQMNHVRSNYQKRTPELATDYAENDNNVRSLSFAEVPQLNRL